MPVLLHPKGYERVAQELALGKRPEEACLIAEVLDPDGTSFADNARRLAQHYKIKRRVQELRTQRANRDAELAEINLDWLKLKLKRYLDFNIDDYLTPPDANGERHYDISKCSREQLDRLAAVAFNRQDITSDADRALHQKREIVHTAIKPHDIIGAANLMARLLGSVEERAPRDGPSITFNIQALPIEDQRLIAAALENEPERAEAAAVPVDGVDSET